VAHDPERQAGYLRQSLSQGRRPLGFFLGAGCPVSIKDENGNPLIPDVAGLTQQVGDVLSGSALAGAWKNLLGQLPKDANVEAILSHIRALRAVAGDEALRGLSPDDLERLETTLCREIAQVAGKRLPDDTTPFHRLASWAGSSLRAYPVELFTPNYDVLIEQALEETHVPYFDGFVGSVDAFFDLHAIEVDQLPSRWVRLWKIHGSINWRLGEKGVVHRGQLTDPSDVRVIYPSHLKYEQSRRMPYLALLDRLKMFIRQPSSVLIASGFSFRDEHLNEVLLEGAEGNPSAVIFGLLHGELAKYEEAVQIATRRANITLLAEDGAVVGTRQADWPTVDVEPQAQDTVAVKWKAPKKGELYKASFQLGDFDVVGTFLGEVSGEQIDEIDTDAS
jgi:hypothetical protein